MKNISDMLHESTFKFMSNEKLKYDDLKENETTQIFSSITDTLLCAFAIGYHFDKKTECSGGVTIVNLSSVPTDVRELMIRLVLDRFPNLEITNEIWKIAGEYAEWGITVLYHSMKANHYHLFIDDVLG